MFQTGFRLQEVTEGKRLIARVVTDLESAVPYPIYLIGVKTAASVQ